jgi:hypothetical protein
MYTVIGVMEPRFTGLNPGSSIGLIVPASQIPQFPEPAIHGAFNIWADFLVRRELLTVLDSGQCRSASPCLGTGLASRLNCWNPCWPP